MPIRVFSASSPAPPPWAHDTPGALGAHAPEIPIEGGAGERMV